MAHSFSLARLAKGKNFDIVQSLNLWCAVAIDVFIVVSDPAMSIVCCT